MTGDLDGSPVINVEELSGLLLVDGLKFSKEAVASVVDDDVYAAEFVQGSFESIGYRGRRGKIDRLEKSVGIVGCWWKRDTRGVSGKNYDAVSRS